jgi:hypothetical protein
MGQLRSPSAAQNSTTLMLGASKRASVYARGWHSPTQAAFLPSLSIVSMNMMGYTLRNFRGNCPMARRRTPIFSSQQAQAALCQES